MYLTIFPLGFVKPTSFNKGLLPIFPVRYNFIEVGYLRGIPKDKLFKSYLAKDFCRFELRTLRLFCHRNNFPMRSLTRAYHKSSSYMKQMVLIANIFTFNLLFSLPRLSEFATYATFEFANSQRKR